MNGYEANRSMDGHRRVQPLSGTCDAELLTRLPADGLANNSPSGPKVLPTARAACEKAPKKGQHVVDRWRKIRGHR